MEEPKPITDAVMYFKNKPGKPRKNDEYETLYNQLNEEEVNLMLKINNATEEYDNEAHLFDFMRRIPASYDIITNQNYHGYKELPINASFIRDQMEMDKVGTTERITNLLTKLGLVADQYDFLADFFEYFSNE